MVLSTSWYSSTSTFTETANFFFIFHQQWILLKVLVKMSADSETYQNYKKLRIAVSKELSLSGFQIGKELGAHRIKAAKKSTGSH